MTQPTKPTSPLTARLYDLEYPRSLGVYSTYEEVQTVVDTLADHEFPVQSTLIVGTDLKLMERVTGRRTWGRVIGQGVLSGIWMGLFLGLLLLLLTPGSWGIILSSILMGIVFFTVWAIIGYALTGGRRDFTSTTATIPMQYELLVEHRFADRARQILAESGATPPVPQAPSTPLPGRSPAPSGQGRPGVAPQPAGASQQPAAGTVPAPVPATGGQATGANRPTFGRPAPTAPEQGAGNAPQPPRRPSFGQPAGTPQREDLGGSEQPSPQSGAPVEPDHRSPAPPSEEPRG